MGGSEGETPEAIDVLLAPVRLLASMPLATTVQLELATGEGVWLTWSKTQAAALSAEGAAVVTPIEAEALCVVLADSAWMAARVLGELRRRAAPTPDGGGGYAPRRMTARALLGPDVRRVDGDGRSWTMGRLCEALSARMVCCSLESRDAVQGNLGRSVVAA